MNSSLNLKASRKNSSEEIKRLIASKYPIVWIESWEEDRVDFTIKKLAEKAFSSPLEFRSWKATDKSQSLEILEILQNFVSQTTPPQLAEFAFDVFVTPI